MWVITLPTRIKKTFKSLRFRFIVAYLLIIAVAFALIGAVTIQLVGENLYRQEGKNAQNRLEGLSISLTKPLEEGDYIELYDLISRAADAYAVRLLICDENARVVTDSLSLINGHELSISLDNEINTHAFKRDKDYGEYLNLSYSEAQNVLLSAKSHAEIAPKGENERILLSTLSLNHGYTLISVENADDVKNVELKGLATKLLITLGALLIASIVPGLILTRSETRPIRELSTAITKLSAGDFSVRVSEKGTNELSDLSRAFNDMTGRMEMLDRSRNQFVSNASHELKTPLATIKIMVQTLLFQEVYDEDMSKEFLTDVDKETDRLNAVVTDLLTLVGMDSGESKLNMEEFSLSEMISDDVKRLSPLARERGVELEITQLTPLDAYGDKIKLDQVFYNLIDNAIKYTPRGAGVKVELTGRGKNAVIRVRDNGIGIPEEDQKHIFDRFYRVDKARSRETGGTGLGLSIAKQIILAHNGTISVSSKVDEGSVFTVTLPAAGKNNQRQAQQ